MMILKNGSRPLMWSQGLGSGGERNFIGVVLAEWDKHYPFVVWHMASDDGDKWDTFSGTYCQTLEEAKDLYRKKTGTDYQRQTEALATGMKVERNLNV
tara:strand:- start:2334 stop:2627 length:294 start_codon:yes stop_codon:yes gene_type:complete